MRKVISLFEIVSDVEEVQAFKCLLKCVIGDPAKLRCVVVEEKDLDSGLISQNQPYVVLQEIPSGERKAALIIEQSKIVEFKSNRYNCFIRIVACYYSIHFPLQYPAGGKLALNALANAVIFNET